MLTSAFCSGDIFCNDKIDIDIVNKLVIINKGIQKNNFNLQISKLHKLLD